MDNLRRFIIVVSLILLFTFGICGFFLASSFRDSTEETNTQNLSFDLPTFDPNSNVEDETKIFHNNIILIIGSREKPETELLMLMNIDSSTSNINITYIPKDIRYVNYRENTISSIGSIMNSRVSMMPAYDACGLYESILDISIPYYIYFTEENFIDFMHTFAINGIDFNIPIDMMYQDDNYNINLTKDTAIIKKDQILQFIQFYKTVDNSYRGEMLKYYDGTDAKRLEMCRQLFDAFMQQTFINPTNQYFKLRFYDAFLPFLSKCETNITSDVLSVIAPVFANVQDSNIRYFTLTGQEHFTDRYYMLFDADAEGSFVNMTDGSKFTATAGLKTYFPSNS